METIHRAYQSVERVRIFDLVTSKRSESSGFKTMVWIVNIFGQTIINVGSLVVSSFM